MRSRLAILHSRYASRKNTMRERQAHPVSDDKDRISVFHNGFVTNYKELAKELFPNKDPSKCTLSDSELIALMIGKLMDEGTEIKSAIQNLVETKLIGTWKLAIVLNSEPNKIYITKNAGPFFLGESSKSVILCSDFNILAEHEKNYIFRKLRSNMLYEISDEC